MIKQYATLYAMKERNKLSVIFDGLIQQKKVIDDWFTDFGNRYTNSVLMKASYDSPIRKPYNDKFDEYSVLMREYRMVNYYLERLRER